MCDDSVENFDVYSTSYIDINNINGIKGHAMVDTPWDLKATPVLSDASLKYMVRDVVTGGVFYYKSSGGEEDAVYRVVLK